MKTVQELLGELKRPDISEVAVASERLPCVKIGDKYEPVDTLARSTQQILDILVAAGGSRHVAQLEKEPAQWSHRLDGIGSIEVQAFMRAGRVQARIWLKKGASLPALPSLGGVAPAARGTLRSGGAPPVPPGARGSHPVVDGNAVLPELEIIETGAPSSIEPPTSSRIDRERKAVKTIEDLLSISRDANASDVHVVGGRPLLLRLGGELLPRGAPIDPELAEKLILGSVPERAKPRLASLGSVDFALDGGPLGRFRVNVGKHRGGVKACFRCIPPSVPTLQSLGLPPEIERGTHHHQGLVLVTGPTGHGKTSTMAAIVDIINRNTTHHVITVEDPVEYVHPRKKAVISQREVGTHTRSFHSALKGSLREDPDVIVVGELRDTETVRMALEASETGHLVIGTMNTPSAAKTIDRLVDLFPPADQQMVRMSLAGGLHLIVSQRLLPAADGNGMVAAVELLPGSVALWSLIRDDKTFQIPSLQQRGKALGIIRLDESLTDLVLAGRVTREAAAAVADRPHEVEAAVTARLAAQNAPPPPPPDAVKAHDASTLLGKASQILNRGR
jgi:twitching motility protein PilT